MKALTLRAWLLLLGIATLIIFAGQKIGPKDGIVIAGVMALSITALIIWYADWRLIPSLKTRNLEGQDPWGLGPTLQKLSEKARVPPPKVWIVEDPAPQTLVVGRGIGSGKIFVTDGLLKKFSHEELTIVLAYHLVCIKSRATFSFSVASAIADFILFIGESLDWIVNGVLGSKRNSKGELRFFSRALSPLAMGAVGLVLGHQPYLNADLQTAQLMGQKDLLAQVLWKLQSYSQTQPFKVYPAASHFFMVNPLTPTGWDRYFHAHPTVQKRIENLIGHYPI